MTLEDARALYPEIKELLPLVSQEWSESYNLRESVAEICIPNRFNGEVEPIAHILPGCPYDDRRMILKAPVYTRALWVLLQEAFRRIPAESAANHAQPEKKRQTLAQTCGRMCNDADFLRFLAVCHNVDTADRERVASRVRTMIRVESRAELDTDEAAKSRWFSLCDEFRAWKAREGK